jgi:TonB family protein
MPFRSWMRQTALLGALINQPIELEIARQMGPFDEYAIGRRPPARPQRPAGAPNPPTRWAPDRRYRSMVVAAVASIILHSLAISGLWIVARHLARIRTTSIDDIYVTVISGARQDSSRPAHKTSHKSVTPRANHNDMALVAPRFRSSSHHHRRVDAAASRSAISRIPASPAIPAATPAMGSAATTRRSFGGGSVNHPRAEARSGAGAQTSLNGNSTDPIARAPMLLSGGVPEYPENARQAEIEGQVTLQIVVDPAGRVEPDIKVVESIPTLDAAAIDAVRRWRFAPGRDRYGNPIRFSVKVPLRFVLR